MLDSVTGNYVFAATEGLNPEQLGKVSLSVSEGLIGQVASREEPLNLDRARKSSCVQIFPGNRRGEL